MTAGDSTTGGRRTDRGSTSTGGEPALEDLSAELSSTLRDLRRELGPDRGPFGLPRPPSPREVLRFTESYAIPTAIAVLEANIRALEMLAAAIRAVEGSATGAERARDRAESVSRASLDRLDDALGDIQNAIEGRPDNDAARRLLEDARTLRDEIDERLRSAPGTRGTGSSGGRGGGGGGGGGRGGGRGRGDSGGSDTDGDAEAGEGQDVHEVPVDVEGELESLRRDVDADEEGDAGTGNSGGS